MEPLTQPIQEYRSRLAAWQLEHAGADLQYRRLGNIRLAAGIGLAIIASIALGPGWISAWWLWAPVIPLVVLFAWMPSVDRRRDRAARGIAYFERGIARLEDRWAGVGSTGDVWRDPSHLFAEDLDLFGKGSLFQLLCAARTATGERALASWLMSPGKRGEVVQRQDAVRELAGRLDLRQDVALIGDDIRVALDDRKLASWGAGAPVKFFPGARLVAMALGAAAVATFVLWWTDVLPLFPFLLVALAEIGFVAAIREPMGQITTLVNSPAQELQLIASILELLEAQSFSSPELVNLQARLRASDKQATAQIRRLVRLVEWMEWAHNQIFAPIGAAILWIPQFAIAIETWRQECGQYIGEWIAAVGEVEALVSLATFAYERPAAVFPELTDSAGAGPFFAATALAHPLIAPSEAVANDVALSKTVPMWIVSGSNMSGKSTLLRAVGLSAAMAWAGAPVTAAGLKLSCLRVGASLRTNDSLADHRSRFYAEISRLKQIMDAAGSGEPVLFLVDELLSGTNSHDRRIGAEAVLLGLLERGAIGLATTHDLALTEIATRVDGRAKNVHLEDYLEAGQIRFDYKLRAGVVERSNALELMRAVGLDV